MRGYFASSLAEEILGLRLRERRNFVKRLTMQTQPLAACCKNSYGRAMVKDLHRDPRCRRNDVFAVIDHQNHLPVADVIDNILNLGLSGSLRDSERRSHRREQRILIRNRTEIDEPCAARISVACICGCANCQARFSDSAWAFEANDAMPLEQLRDLSQFGSASDQRREFVR